MKLKIIEFEFKWPKDFLVNDLRQNIVDELCKYGEPLRWAITGVQSSIPDGSLRVLRVEAVVIIL